MTRLLAAFVAAAFFLSANAGPIMPLGDSPESGVKGLWATVMFDVAISGSIDDSIYDVQIPYAALKPYLKPDAPILSK